MYDRREGNSLADIVDSKGLGHAHQPVKYELPSISRSKVISKSSISVPFGPTRY